MPQQRLSPRVLAQVAEYGVQTVDHGANHVADRFAKPVEESIHVKQVPWGHSGLESLLGARV